MNSVAVIYNPKILKISLSKILRQIKRKHRKDFVVFIGNDSSQEELCRRNKIFFLNIDVFADDFNIDEASKTAFKFSKLWHLNLKLDYKNINLGKFFENDIYISILNVLKSIDVLENILRILKTNIFYLINSASPYIHDNNNNDSLFFYIPKVLINNKGREDLRLKINFVEENNISAVCNEIKNKYFKFCLLSKEIIDSAKYFAAKNKINKTNGKAKKIAFLIENSLNENYSHLINILSVNQNYELCFLLKEFSSKTNAFINKARFKKFFPHIFSRTKEEKNIWSSLRYLRKDANVKNVFWYKHRNIWKIILDEIYMLFKLRLRKAFGIIKYFEKKLLRENVKLIIGSEAENDFNKIMFLLSKDLKIKTIDLQNNILLDESYNFAPAYYTKMLVWDKVTALSLIEHGHDADKIELTGNFKYLNYDEKNIPRKRQFCEKAGLNPKDKLVLIALSGGNNLLGFNDPHLNENLIKWGINLAENSEGIQIIFKPHSDFTANNINRLRRRISLSPACANIFIDENYFLPELLKNINLCVCGGIAQILLDVLYFNKPIIYVNTGAKNLIKKYADKSVMIEVNNEEDFMRYVRLLLSNLKINKELEANRIKFIKEYLPQINTQLNEKTLKIVESMLN